MTRQARQTGPLRREIEVLRCPCVEPMTGLRCEAALVNLCHGGRCWSVPRNEHGFPTGRRVFWKPAYWPQV